MIVDTFGREVSVGDTIVYALNKDGLEFYQISKVEPTYVSAHKYNFLAFGMGWTLSERPVGLRDPHKMMIIPESFLPT